MTDSDIISIPLSVNKDTDVWDYCTPIPWSESYLPDLELISETPYMDLDGEIWYRWIIRKKINHD